MKELTKVFKGVNIQVDVIDDKNMYFNISGVASKFGKRIAEWKNQKGTKEYFKNVGKATNLSESELVKQIGNETKLHNKVFVNFARFISVEFAIKADDIIMEILLGEKELCNKKFEKVQLQLETAQKQIKELRSKRMKTYKDGFVSLRKYLKDNNINMTEDTAISKLIAKNVVEKRDIICSKSFLLDEYYGRQKGDSVIEFNSRALDEVFEEYIDIQPTLF